MLLGLRKYRNLLATNQHDQHEIVPATPLDSKTNNRKASDDKIKTYLTSVCDTHWKQKLTATTTCAVLVNPVNVFQLYSKIVNDTCHITHKLGKIGKLS